MADETEKTPPQGPEDEGWVDVGEGPPVVESEIEAAPVEQEIVYRGKQPTPPWKLSAYVGGAGLILMAMIYVFPELRRFQTPWNPSFPTAVVLLVFPLFSLIWSIIGYFGKQHRVDRTRSIPGAALSLLTVALCYAVIVTDPALETDTGVVADPRMNMTEEELREWRIEKLNR